MTDETAQEILNGNHTGLTGNIREDDLICMAKLWLMRPQIISDLNNFADLASDELGKDVTQLQEFAQLIEALEAEC